MTRQEISEKLKEILLLAMPDGEAILKDCTEESDLHTDLGLNSVGVLYLVIAIEEFFSISFDNTNFNDFKTVGDVVDYIALKQTA